MDFTKSTLNYPAGADTPIRRVIVPRAPTSSDIKNFILGDEWLDSSSDDWWKLCSNALGSALWIKIGGTASQVETLTGNSGGTVPPTVGNNINTLGSGSITIVGSPGTNTTTTQLTGLTNHAVLVGAGSDTITNLGLGTDGTVLVGNTSADPAFSNTVGGNGVFHFQGSTAGTARVVEVIHTDSTNPASSAAFQASCQAGGGKAFNVWAVVSGNGFSQGIDSASSSILKTYFGSFGSGTLVSQVTSAGVPSFPSASFTQFAPLVAGASGIVASIAAAGTTGQLLVGATGANPAFASVADGNFIFRNSVAATVRSVEIQNNSATAGSNSILSLNATTGGGNTVLQWGIIGGNAFQMGQVQASSGSIKTYYGTLGSGTLISELTSTGIQTLPLQPAFFAYLASSVVNATGNGAAFQLGSGTALTKRYDIGTNFNVNGTFTAPVAGIYEFMGAAMVNNCTIASKIDMLIITTSANYDTQTARTASATNLGHTISVLAQMSAGDTAVCKVQVNGEAANTDTVAGDGTFPTAYFCGRLVQ